MRPLPKREISEPQKKLGRYIARMCHWMPRVESVTENPQPIMAMGVAVITMFIMACATIPQATATMNLGTASTCDSARAVPCAAALIGGPS